jgi:hypothetical protein
MELPLKILIWLAVFTCSLVLLSGCVTGPDVYYKYEISDPYSVSGEITARINATAYVDINNSRGGQMRFRLINATMTPVHANGSTETIVGVWDQDGVIPSGGTRRVMITFSSIPIRYALLDNPPRFHPLITHYDVNVTYAGQAKVLVVWTPERVEGKNMRIPLKDMPVGDYFSKLNDVIDLDG